MLHLILFGPPGAGKGTQSEKLVEKYELCHLSTGDIFRYNIKNETDLGKLAKSYMDKGELVPDEVTIKMLEAEVDKNADAKGFIFDGFPRTIPQAKALDTFLNSKGAKVDAMIALHVDEEELVKRLLLRGKDSARADDQNEDVIRKRISVYNEQTAQVAGHYEGLGRFHQVNGEQSIDEVFNNLCGIINKL
ncbi:adenylate kinase [Luteibaculum oceani]|uniref:Adenylate kinase n=1 Tax=Luteibaculum oceani TaxID=1294296 RepID=A0A5C6V0J1_9FLAO|nr:adenylate kinase [Luteibaculum oceani]TXC78444.1 adenylate kinase [Luteibaculum oceani]